MAQITRRKFAVRVLKETTGSAPRYAVNAVVAWMLGESGLHVCDGKEGAAYNPLNTTRHTDDVESDFNSAHVRNYRTLDAGIAATVETLKLSFYDDLRAVLGRSGVTTVECCKAIGASPWGTSTALIKRARESYSQDREFYNQIPVGKP